MEARNSASLDATLKVTPEYEARQQFNPQYSYKNTDSKPNTTGIIRPPYPPGPSKYQNNYVPPYQYPYMLYNHYPYYPTVPMPENQMAGMLSKSTFIVSPE